MIKILKKKKNRNDLNFEKVVLLDNNKKELLNSDKTKFLQLLYDCVEASEFKENEMPSLLFAFDYETIMNSWINVKTNSV